MLPLISFETGKRTQTQSSGQPGKAAPAATARSFKCPCCATPNAAPSRKVGKIYQTSALRSSPILASGHYGQRNSLLRFM